MGVIKTVDIHTVNELFILAQPAHLQKYAGKALNQKERDEMRANLIREKLKKSI
jgi:protein-arginine kinase